MSSVDRIQATEANLGNLQVGLAAVQDGLHHAESIARSADQVERAFRRSTVLVLGLVGVSVVLVAVVGIRRLMDARTDDR